MSDSKTGRPPIDVEARHAATLGDAPRIGPLPQEEFTEELFELAMEVRAGAGAPRTDVVPEFMATMLRHPELFRRHSELAVVLFNGALPVRLRELAILRLAWLCGAPYEWCQHVGIAKRLGGVTDAEVERCSEGSTAPGWDELDGAIVRAVEELHADAMISGDTWDLLARHLNDKQLIELPIMLGQYQGVAYLQNSLHCRLMEGRKGLAER